MVRLINGDCLEMLKPLDDSSVDSVVTDPPYELGFMGKAWDKTGIAFRPDVWLECLRVLKPGGHLLAFGGSRTFHRMAVAIEDAGLEIRDTIMWIYGSGFPKSHNISIAIDKLAWAEREVTGIVYQYSGESRGCMNGDFSGNRVITAPATPAAAQWDGWGTALKPAHEPIILARKPLQGTVAENVLQWGTGGINVDGCRIGHDIRHNQSAGNTDREKWRMNTTEVLGRYALGRWPANVIHDGSAEVVAAFPYSVSTGGNTLASSSNTCYGKWDTGRLGANSGGLGDSGSAARFFYCAKASKADRDEGMDGFDERSAHKMSGGICIADGRISAKGKAIARNYHPTVKPTALMRYLCKLVTPPGGIVLDPFMGSGSTGKAAVLEGFSFIGIEREFEYMEISAARIAYVSTDKIESPIVVNQKPKPEIRQTGLF